MKGSTHSFLIEEDSPKLFPSTKNEEITIVSKLRGFASMSVFLFHLVCVTNGYLSEGIFYKIFHYGKYGVQFFFVISGFVISYSMLKGNYTISDFFTFLKKRIIRIEPPYLVIVFLTIIFLIVRNKSGLGNGDINLPGFTQIALHIGYLIPFSSYGWISIVFWTLAIEFQFYLLFSMIFQWYVHNQWLRWVLEGILLFLFFTSSSEAFFLHWSPVFLLGINLALYRMRMTTKIEFVITSLFMCIAILNKMGVEVFLFSSLPFILIYLEPSLKSKIWDFFGKISYSLYLCHTLIAFSIINVAMRFPQHLYHKIFFGTLAFGITIFCSYLLYYFVEKPFKRMASTIKYIH